MLVASSLLDLPQPLFNYSEQWSFHARLRLYLVSVRGFHSKSTGNEMNPEPPNNKQGRKKIKNEAMANEDRERRNRRVGPREKNNSGECLGCHTPPRPVTSSEMTPLSLAWWISSLRLQWACVDSGPLAMTRKLIFGTGVPPYKYDYS